MEGNPFQTRVPNVADNDLLRIPQREAFLALRDFCDDNEATDREVGVVLPVGCGKSGCITLVPFAFSAKRTLVVAPGVNIARQLASDFDPAQPAMFYTKCRVLDGEPYPEPVEIRGTSTNLADLEQADVVVTNIQQLQGAANRWLDSLPPDFFDVIEFDEGHHNVAESWDTLRAKFPAAKIVNFSATPLRADGQLMAGRIIYSFPIYRAIEEGYIKRLKAVVLEPRTLRYVRDEDGHEVEVELDEVRRLGEEDADFRRSIVSSKETLDTIVNASIRELQKLREASGDNRLKIIASALNYRHCSQVVAAYSERGLRAGYIHSREASDANQRVLNKLDNHELDVIVQVRKLGEGFDHPHLSVAAVFSIFSNLSPFIQFVGRIMRVIPGATLNHGVVVFHAGSNVARRWEDFRTFSEADQEYFDQLLPMEGLDFHNSQELEIEPHVSRTHEAVDVRGQTDVRVQEIPLLEDKAAIAALQILQERGYSTDEVREAYEQLQPVAVTKVRRRQAGREALNMRIKTEAAKILQERKLNPEGHDLDRNRLGRSNFVVVKAALDNAANAAVGHKPGERSDFTQPELDEIEREFTAVVGRAIAEVFDA